MAVNPEHGTALEEVRREPGSLEVLTKLARHPISYAARASGLHPQTLRDYDRRGVIRASRTEGGKRLFSDVEIERARRIRALSDEGVPLAAARRIIRLEELLQTTVRRLQVLDEQNRRLSARLQHLEVARR